MFLKVQWIQCLENQAQHWPDREVISCWQWRYKSKDYLYSWVGPVPLCRTCKNHRFQLSQRSSSKETGGNGRYESVPLQDNMPSTGLQTAFGSDASDLSDVGTQEAEGVCASVSIGSWTKEKAIIQRVFLILLYSLICLSAGLKRTKPWCITHASPVEVWRHQLFKMF